MKRHACRRERRISAADRQWNYFFSSETLAERLPRQRLEQYFTSSQQWAHFLRQLNGLEHVRQILDGKSTLATPLGIITRYTLQSFGRCSVLCQGYDLNLYTN